MTAPGGDGLGAEIILLDVTQHPIESSRATTPIFDSHLHIVDPRFPLVPNQGYLPDPFTVPDYLARVGPVGVTGGVVVSGSFQAFDQSYLLDALIALGPMFVGVTQLPVDCPDEQIVELHAAGVRAVRFNLVRGGSAGLADVDALGRRVFDVAGWHSEFYLRSSDLTDLLPTLARLPQISIDHLGLTVDGFEALLALVDAGAKVKATGFGRGDLDVVDALRRINQANPDALMFGTDLPSTRAPRPFQTSDIDLLRTALTDQAVTNVLHGNAIRLYRPAGG